MPKEKVIFIYGLEGKKEHAKTARRVLDEYDVICFEYDSALIQPIEEIAEELSQFINSKTSKNEKVNLIGVSAGGIIATYYQKFLSRDKVDKLVTICSPFKGSYVPGFYGKKRIGVKQLSKNSPFLKKLNSKKSGEKVLNFYSNFDILVPGDSGKGENPVHTKNFFHFFIQKDKRIFVKIKEFFKN